MMLTPPTKNPTTSQSEVEFHSSQQVIYLAPSDLRMCDTSLQHTPTIEDLPSRRNLLIPSLSLGSASLKDTTSSSTFSHRLEPFKSSSLSNIATRPMTIGIYGDSNPTVTRRPQKHTKTFSESENLPRNFEHVKGLRRHRSPHLRNDLGRSRKRHAIYTQSLYVPLKELSESCEHSQNGDHNLCSPASLGLLGSSGLGLSLKPSQLRKWKVVDSSLNDHEILQKENSQLGSHDPLDTSVPKSTYLILSAYSLDSKKSTIDDSIISIPQTTALPPKAAEQKLEYPPIILEILADLDAALKEWSFSS